MFITRVTKVVKQLLQLWMPLTSLSVRLDWFFDDFSNIKKKFSLRNPSRSNAMVPVSLLVTVALFAVNCSHCISSHLCEKRLIFIKETGISQKRRKNLTFRDTQPTCTINILLLVIINRSLTASFCSLVTPCTALLRISVVLFYFCKIAILHKYKNKYI